MSDPGQILDYNLGAPRLYFETWDCRQNVHTIEAMPQGLMRYQQTGDLHLITTSCYGRKPLLASPEARDRFETSLERMRLRYEFCVLGYVVMPEHVHLLVSEPKRALLASALHALKLSVAVQSQTKRFWTVRYHDFNVFTEAKRLEKLRYLHRNPVARGLVIHPGDWRWSSFRHYATGEHGVVEIESAWTAAQRMKDARDPMSRIRDMGHPAAGPVVSKSFTSRIE